MTTRLALAALAVGSAVAFAPRSTLLPRSAPTRAAPTAIPRILNPLDWSVDRQLRPKVEGQDLFRQLGISPESDFEDVKAAVEQLKLKYDKDPKKKIKLEVVQDKIMELRLRQAGQGKIAKSGTVARLDSKAAAAAAAVAARNKGFQAPKWTKGLIRPATKKQVLAYAKWIFGFAFVGGCVFPPLNGPMTILVVMAGTQNVYRRGRPKRIVDPEMPGAGSQDFPTGTQFGQIIVSALVCQLPMLALAGLAQPLLIPQYLSPTKYAKDQVQIFFLAAGSLAMSSLVYLYDGKKKK
eukprot:CAMPEP_0172583722 /NCGR_PEP_ID=MMETSP1068-20121228/3283_1 /TAXON_ID=35684 /ORGANISM="Pseudopedinella elastica, Strain CCMP716" /LENGTH=293 /DNA_ID=CAMNT_0013377615 /DNA_START=153 /DNA_END=1034 /DNA_ORIENTATION=+